MQACFFQDGSPNFESVYKLYYDSLRYFARSLVKDEMEAEDIALQTLQKLFVLIDRFDSLSNIKAFLFITARNACFDYLKRLQRWQNIRKELEISLGDQQELANNQERIDLLNTIYTEIERLPGQRRTVLNMIFYQGLKTSEVASLLNMTEQAVRNCKTRAIDQLRPAVLSKLSAIV